MENEVKVKESVFSLIWVVKLLLPLAAIRKNNREKSNLKKMQNKNHL
jgi:hypothetical protein